MCHIRRSPLGAGSRKSALLIGPREEVRLTGESSALLCKAAMDGRAAAHRTAAASAKWSVPAATVR
jgi:hypothetical protein